MNGNLAYREFLREELIDGKIVAMSPRPTISHAFVSGNIYRLFANYLHRKKCTPFADGVDLFLTEKDRFVPDMVIVCDPDKIKGDGVHGAPDLVVEVLSPSTAKRDKEYKKNVYARCGVREYWIVSTVEKSIEQYFLRDGIFELNAVYTLHPEQNEVLTEEELAAVETHFKCSLFDDLELALEDIFYRTF